MQSWTSESPRAALERFKALRQMVLESESLREQGQEAIYICKPLGSIAPTLSFGIQRVFNRGNLAPLLAAWAVPEQLSRIESTVVALIARTAFYEF
jgi:hypothetical protein